MVCTNNCILIENCSLCGLLVVALIKGLVVRCSSLLILSYNICTNRESSRVVFILFEHASAIGKDADDTQLLTELKRSGDAVPLLIALGKTFETWSNRTLDSLFIATESSIVEADQQLTGRGEVDQEIKRKLAAHNLTVNQRIHKTYTILLSSTLMVSFSIALLLDAPSTSTVVLKILCTVNS